MRRRFQKHRAARAWLLFAFVATGVAPSFVRASEGEERVRRDVEQFVLAGVPEPARSEAGTAVDTPPLTSFTVDRNRYPGDLRTEITTRARRPFEGRVPVAVALYAGDRLVKRGVVTPYVRRMQDVWVAKRDLRVGSIVRAADLEATRRDVTRLPANLVTSQDDLIGLRVRRSIRQGQPFRANQVEPVPVVERGDRVQIVLEAGALRISATGKAQETGARGDWIRVLNLDSKRELSGRVDEQGRVHVAF